MKKRLSNILDASSQLFQVTFCPRPNDTNANESFSGRSYREDWSIKHFINALFFWQEDHCKEADESDYQRALDKVRQRQTYKD